MPVVRCTLRCVYCALIFQRDFDKFDDIHATMQFDIISVQIANVRKLETISRRRWFGFLSPADDTEETREAVKCPHCGSNCRLLDRAPINHEKGTKTA